MCLLMEKDSFFSKQELKACTSEVSNCFRGSFTCVLKRLLVEASMEIGTEMTIFSPPLIRMDLLKLLG